MNEDGFDSHVWAFEKRNLLVSGNFGPREKKFACQQELDCLFLEPAFLFLCLFLVFRYLYGDTSEGG